MHGYMMSTAGGHASTHNQLMCCHGLLMPSLVLDNMELTDQPLRRKYQPSAPRCIQDPHQDAHPGSGVEAHNASWSVILASLHKRMHAQCEKISLPKFCHVNNEQRSDVAQTWECSKVQLQ